LRERIELFRKTVSGMMLTLLLTSMLTLAFNVQPVKASGTIYIRTDGSIDPPDAPISTLDNVTYTLTGNITSSDDGIIVERDNIIIDGDGYTVQGTEKGTGLYLNDRKNITIKNMTTKTFEYGIYLYYSSHNSIVGNNITNNTDDIYLYVSSYNSISGNNITASNDIGIRPDFSSDNTISENNITNNHYGMLGSSSDNNTISENNITSNDIGIRPDFSFDNTIFGNNITNNGYGVFLSGSSNYNNISGNNIKDNDRGIYVLGSSNNIIHPNNFIKNTRQVYSDGSPNVWDNGYPSCGNYWSDYVGVDLYSGPYQNETGSDGIGDAPYVIDTYNRDNYPLMKPYPWDLHNIGVTYIGKVWEICFPPIILPLKTVVGLGFRLHINVFVMNYGDYSEVFNVTVYANITVIDTITNITLASGSSVVLNLTWDTTGFAKGNYTISAYAWPVQGETDTEHNWFTNGQVRVVTSGDVDGDGIVSMKDIYTELVLRFMRKPRDLGYSANSDINDDGIINMKDIYIAIIHFMQTDP
jgi:parallel beta-helix repeat protein